MRIIFLSNFFNHHQKPLSDELYALIGDGYRFVETSQMDSERVKLGWQNDSVPGYVVKYETYAQSNDKIVRDINEADVVIWGSAPHDLINDRIKAGKTVVRYAERPLKKGIEPFKYFPRLIKWHVQNPQNKPIYMLCASAYTASDFAMFGMYKNKCFKWGYFPECKQYDDIDALIASKKKNSLLWCGRLIDWKHPELAVEVAKRLKKDGYSFSLDIVGAGDMEYEIKTLIEENDLSDCVFMRGAMLPERVREYMEQSEIYLFTSDRQEGWGVVLNESMNSACAVVANKAIGSVPFLINDGENGLLYSDGDVDRLYASVKHLMDNESERKAISSAAYYTIRNEWSPKIAADRLIELLNNGLKAVHSDGPCSNA